jgi:NNP family nitrate/nitrite transporter-like MFS transporter
MKILLLFIFWSLWFLNFSSRTVFSPLLPIIEEELTLTHAMAGSLFIFLSVGYTITLILGGFVSPYTGHKRGIAAGFLIMTIALFWLRLAQSYWSLALAILFVGIGSGIYMPSMIPIITATFDRQRWGRTIAVHDTAASFSIFAIPILVAAFLRFSYWRNLFPIFSAACLGFLLIFWIFSPDPRVGKHEDARFFDVLGRKDFWVMATLWIFAAAANIGVYNVIPLFLVTERAMPLETANTVFGVSRVGGIFVSLLVGFLADRYGARSILWPAFLITGISTIGLAVVRDFAALVTMLIVQGSVSLGFFPVGLLASSKLTTFKDRSIFTGGTMALGVIFGIGLTPVALGAVADAWNFETGIVVLGILTVCSTLCLRELRGL